MVPCFSVPIKHLQKKEFCVIKLNICITNAKHASQIMVPYASATVHLSLHCPYTYIYKQIASEGVFLLRQSFDGFGQLQCASASHCGFTAKRSCAEKKSITPAKLTGRRPNDGTCSIFPTQICPSTAKPLILHRFLSRYTLL